MRIVGWKTSSEELENVLEEVRRLVNNSLWCKEKSRVAVWARSIAETLATWSVLKLPIYGCPA